MSAVVVTTGSLKDALLRSFSQPEYATFFEVADGTGAHASRYADAVSMACWPSRGLKLIGFEVKASRSDWLREKKNPKKSVAVQRYCNQWILVTAPGVVELGELPDTWGHMELHGRKLVTVTKAPGLTAEPPTREFMAAMLRRAAQATESVLKARVAAELQDARAAMDKEIAEAVARKTERNAAAFAACERFKAVTGVDLFGRWDSPALAERVGKDFAVFHKLCDSMEYRGLDRTEEQLREAADRVRDALAALRAAGVIREERE